MDGRNCGNYVIANAKICATMCDVRRSLQGASPSQQFCSALENLLELFFSFSVRLPSSRVSIFNRTGFLSSPRSVHTIFIFAELVSSAKSSSFVYNRQDDAARVRLWRTLFQLSDLLRKRAVLSPSATASRSLLRRRGIRDRRTSNFPLSRWLFRMASRLFSHLVVNLPVASDIACVPHRRLSWTRRCAVA